MREYKEGILLFQIMEDEVWAKAVSDTVGLEAFFQKNRDRYQWGQRAQARVYNAASPALCESLLAATEDGRHRLPLRPGQAAPADSAAVAGAVAHLKALPNVVLEIHGHYQTPADTAATWQSLGQLKQAIDSQGIDASRVTVRMRKGKAAGLPQLLYYSTELRDLENAFNDTAPLAVKLSEGWYERGEKPVLEQIPWEPGSHTAAFQGRHYHIDILKIEAPRPKELNETRGQVISDYQQDIETAWLAGLRQKHPVKVFRQELKKLAKK